MILLVDIQSILQTICSVPVVTAILILFFLTSLYERVLGTSSSDSEKNNVQYFRGKGWRESCILHYKVWRS